MRNRVHAAGLSRDERGISAVEFALVLPVLLMLVLGSIEVARFTLLSLKLQHAATTLADLAARDELLTEAGLDDLFSAARRIAAPFDVATEGAMIVTGIAAEDGSGALVYWRRAAGLAETLSVLGETGGAADLPDTLAVDDGETVIAAEVLFNYQRWLLGVIPNRTLRRLAFYRPRLGTLRELG